MIGCRKLRARVRELENELVVARRTIAHKQSKNDRQRNEIAALNRRIRVVAGQGDNQ